MKTTLTAVILAKDETLHIERCIRRIAAVADEIFVVDANSSDDTAAIATRCGAKVVSHPWTNYASQFNWALASLPISSEWVIRIDADEYLEDETSDQLKEHLANFAPEVTGVLLRRRIYFMGRWIKHGGVYPVWHLRVWRRGLGRCEARWMDEHVVLTRGEVRRLDLDFTDDNLNNVSWWTSKHNSYASREAVDLLNLKYRFLPADDSDMQNKQASVKRFLKESAYSRLPPLLRPCLYFIYRFVFKFGFLDGREGIAFHVLQGFWYRFLVDVKVLEVEMSSRRSGRPIQALIKERLGVSV